jgi:LuxR family maltose regulon positive regulatory protein
MTAPLLTTKLYIPPVRPEWVSRPRLIERLSAGLDRKLTLISAPAGFGKTTLLSEWLRELGAIRRPGDMEAALALPLRAAWLSLDHSDNEPGRFWAYVIAALQKLWPGIGEPTRTALQSRQQPPIEELLAALINEIAKVEAPFVFVLDDYHVIEAQPIHKALTFLLAHLPPLTVSSRRANARGPNGMHLVIATRADPPMPLSRLRGRGQLNELRTADLRFTLDETAAFLNQVMGLDLTADAVAALEERTEGWIVGLQMAAHSLKGRDRQRAASFVAAFAGSHRYVLDYLSDEVVLQQPENVRTFLLRTAILERLTGSLCDTVSGQEDSQRMLERLDAANLFILPLDDERRWYRYHRLFADLLRKWLRRTQPELVPELHRKASEWFERAGWINDAVSHAMASGDVERVARLVTGNALAIMGHGELTTLATWLEALPQELMRSEPWLSISLAWVLAYAGQLAMVEEQLQEVEIALARVGAPSEAQHIRGHSAAIRAYLAGLRGNMSRAAELCREALEHLPEQDLARGFATSLLGSVLRWSGDLDAAAQVSGQAIAMRQANGHHRVAADAFCDLAALQLTQGQLHEAATTCREALQSADESLSRGGGHESLAGFAHSRMSAVLLEWNDVDAAVQFAKEGIDLAQQWGWADALLFGYGYLESALQAVGDDEGALEAIKKAKQIADSLSPWLGTLVAAWEAQHWLARGNLTAASRWAEDSGLSVDDPFRYEDWPVYRVLARVLIAQGREHENGSLIDNALELLARLLHMAETAGAVGRVIVVRVAQAMALEAQGNRDHALHMLEEALSLAEPQGYVRTFIDWGVPMGLLLRQAASRGIAVDYAGKLLGALEKEAKDAARMTVRAPSSVLLEPLSERELQVLRLLATHLSSTEIAEQLFLSANTIRSHIKSIYSKLDVHSRQDAIVRAEELGLV